MSEDQGGFSKGKIDIEQLPDAIIRLVETMVGIDPNWDLEKWISQQAEDYLQIIEKDLERERIILEQKIQRLQNLTSRINPSQKEADKGQKNLFDCFDISPQAISNHWERELMLVTNKNRHLTLNSILT